jgi:hypothetical protein
VITTHNLTGAPRGATYAALLRFAQQKKWHALLVTRLPEWIDSECRDILGKLRAGLLSEREVKAWPGTILHGNSSAIVRTYRLEDQATEVLVSCVQGLWEWQHPSRPEDLCFLREGGGPVLTTIAHEKDAYFEMNESEFDELRAEVPGLAELFAPAEG